MNLVMRRFLSTSLIICLVLTSFMIIGSDDTYAAAKAKVKKVSFSKKSLDVTLNSKSTKLTITLKKKVKGANCAYITLKNGKKKNVIMTRSIKGKKITASLIGDATSNYSNRLGPGKWKVVKVVLKKGKFKTVYQRGFWSGDTWFPSKTYKEFKAGKTLATAKTKNKTTLTVNAGTPTTVTVNANSPLDIGSYESISATVKNKNNGALITSGKVIFKIRNSSITTNVTADISPSGTAKVNYLIPKPLNYTTSIYVTAEYQGAAGKYRKSSSVEKAISVVEPTYKMINADFYHGGTNFIAEVTLVNARTGASVDGVKVQLRIWDRTGDTNKLPGKDPVDVYTKNGIAKWTISESDLPTLYEDNDAMAEFLISPYGFVMENNKVQITY